MSLNLNVTEVKKRDLRVGSIIAYHGSASELLEKSEKHAYKEPQRSFKQCSDCSQGCAEGLSSLVRDAAVVIHSPLGCCNPAANYASGLTATKLRGLPPQKIQVISTNISVKDTVYGGIQKLRSAIYEAKERFNPKAIFVHSSCAAGIIGDDIESVSDELEYELGIPVIPIYCEGFKSKTWASGFDSVFHGILRKLVKEPEKKDPDLVNIFNFQGVPVFTELLAKLNLKPNYLVQLSSVDDLKRISSAACSTHICETLGTYIAEALEQKYGIPQVKAPSPYGIKWTDEWIRALSKVTNREELGEKLISSEHERIKTRLEEVRQKLKGKKIYVYAGHSYAHNVAELARDLGMELVGMTTLHHDQYTDSGNKELNTLFKLVKDGGDIKEFSVCNRQPYILSKILKKVNPDVMITRHINMAVVGTKLGIPSFRTNDANIICGYDGIFVFAQRIIDLLEKKKFYSNVSSHYISPYTQWWQNEEDPFYFD